MSPKIPKDAFIIDTFEGFQIYVIKGSRVFYAQKGDCEYNAETYAELEATVSKHNLIRRKFVPLNVIKVSSDKEGRITSRNAKDDNEVIFCFSDDSWGSPRNTHTSENLQYREFGVNKTIENRFVKATPENLKILKEIKEIELQMKNLEKQRSALRKTYTSPVTEDDLETKVKDGEDIGKKT